MRIRSVLPSVIVPLFAILFGKCNQSSIASDKIATDSTALKNGGFSDQISYGHHLVEVIGCNDCHTPKKMTAMGPVSDTSLMLSGHPVSMPAPNVNRNEMESKGLAVTNDMTAWIGPWGISYAANLTSDSTGIGSWSESQFIRAMREGKSKGLEGSRQLLPPMPWQDFKLMKDEELKAIFDYLKSIKPTHNVVPPPVPPLMKHS